MIHAYLRSTLIKRLLFIGNLCLSTAAFTGSAMANSADIELLAKKVEQLRVAMLDGDGNALRTLSAPELSYGHSTGILENQAEFIEKIASGKSDFVTLALTEQNIRISGEVALVRHNLKADIRDGGVPNTIHLGVLLVWQKHAGEWKLLARQAFKYPPKAQ